MSRKYRPGNFLARGGKIVVYLLLGLVLAACGDDTATSVSRATSPAQTSAAVTTATTTSPAAKTTQPATTQAQNEVPMTKDEQEVSFKSGNTTYYGTLQIPAGGAARKPAVLLIAGSGPTDRNGNSKLIPGQINTMLFLAHTLGDNGVITLRYDKLGVGKTGLGGYTTSTIGDFGFDEYLDSVRAAYNYLKSRPEVDTAHLGLLGHSEGGLLALVLANELKSSGEIKGLVLAEPQSKNLLQTIYDQVAAQYTAAVKAGQLKQEDMDKTLSELDQANKTLVSTGKLPDNIANPVILQLGYNKANERYLAQIGKYDPPKIAASLPPTLPVLVFCGDKDQQVSCADVQQLMTGFQQGGNTVANLVNLTGVNHVLREVPGTPSVPADYVNQAFSFSSVAGQKLAAFTKSL